MVFLRKFLSRYRFEITTFVILTIAYFSLRLYKIMSLPIFTDEAIYTRWSQIARYDPAWRFISLTDGKQPLFVWFDMLIMRIVSDPLLAGRLVSVFAGFFTMIGLYFLGKEAFKNRNVGIISSFLYLIYPFALVYDRMALYDSLVGTFAVWGLYLEILLVRKLRLDLALILGMVLGGGVLTKTSGFFNIYLMPFLLIIFDWNRKKRTQRLINFILLFGLSSVLAYGYYSVLRLSPFFNIINEKNTIFVYPLHDWVNHPFNFFEGNIRGVWDWFITYLTWPVFLLVISSFFVSFKFLREKILLLIWFMVPFVALALFGRVLYPRFIFFMTLSLLPLSALSISEIYERLRNKYVAFLAILVFLLLAIRGDYMILANFSKAPIPYSDLEQYINGWPGGGGINEVIRYLDKESKKGRIYVLSIGTFGSLPTYSAEIYFGDNKNVEKRGIYPIPETIPKDLLEKAKTMPVYVFFSNQEEFRAQIKSWPLQKILEFQKGTGTSKTILYKVSP